MQEITPQLEKLSREKEILLQFKKNESELDKMSKRIAAFDFIQKSLTKDAKLEEIGKMRATGEDLVKQIDQHKSKIEELD